MVWIPGGGFSSGHGGLSLYGPQYLLDKEVVLVSMNYRQGPLGKLLEYCEIRYVNVILLYYFCYRLLEYRG